MSRTTRVPDPERFNIFAVVDEDRGLIGTVRVMDVPERWAQARHLSGDEQAFPCHPEQPAAERAVAWLAWRELEGGE